MNEINAPHPQHQSWLFFSLITVGCWGLYGAFLHSGQTGMQDPVHGRYKAFLCVGVAYFLTAVLAPDCNPVGERGFLDLHTRRCRLVINCRDCWRGRGI